jgi:hypothetical protein
MLQKVWSPTGRVGRGSSGRARLSKLVSFDSANQAKLMNEGASIMAPRNPYL